MVKVDDSTCLQYVQVRDVVGLFCGYVGLLLQVFFAPNFFFHFKQTYAPLFDCRAQCRQLLSDDCLFMLSQVRKQKW